MRVNDRSSDFSAGGISDPSVGDLGISGVGVHVVCRFAKDRLIVAGRDHFQAGGDGPGAEHVVFADGHIFQALLPPLLGDVFGDFAIVDGTGWMRKRSKVPMLFADFVCGDAFL